MPLYPELWRGCAFAAAPMLGPTGLTLRDWSGQRNHGTLTNMDAAGDWVASSGRYALDFDGTNDYSVSEARGIPSSTDRKAVCFWMYQRTRTSGNNSAVVELAAAGSTFTLQSALITGTVYVCTDSVAFNLIATGAEIPSLNVWNHICFTYNGTFLEYWLNGAYIKATSWPGSATITSIQIGRRSVGAVGYFDGQIDDVRVYNRVPSAQEIRTLATRRGIAYELAPRRRSSSAVQFNRRRRLLLGASL
jgi:hypothetical protein